MSEEFIRVATKEVTEDISEIGNLLKGCQNDEDILKHSVDIEKRIHKLKGLAPMMGQEQIGQITILIDKLLKITMAGEMVPGIYNTIKATHQFMEDSMNDAKTDYSSLKNQIEKNHESFLDQ